MAILLISNPVSGDGTGRVFVQENVVPLLQHAKVDYQLEETTAPGSAGRLAFDFLRKHEHGAHVTIVISGGDGTVHEVVNGIGLSQLTDQGSSDIPYVVSLVVCPQGTANALYSTMFPGSTSENSATAEYRLRSLHAFLDNRSRPLTVTRTQSLASDGQVVETILGVVVASTALHAAILDSAEHLRGSVSGIERFKVAAAQNISTWYHSRVQLRPSKSDGTVRIFDPRLKEFKPFDPDNGSNVDLDGPFQYFLSTVNVDRLEPFFEISPLFVKLPPGPGEMDLLSVRPLRDPSTKGDDSESRANFVKKISAVFGAAYSKGNHVNLRYTQEGVEVSEGEGPIVVEYIRCGGWEWKPNGTDAAAHLVCVDGTILTIPSGGKATCQVLTETGNARFTISA